MGAIQRVDFADFRLSGLPFAHHYRHAIIGINAMTSPCLTG
jgi:hypothetical protein